MRDFSQSLSFAGMLLACSSLSVGKPALLSIGIMLILAAAVWQYVAQREAVQQRLREARQQRTWHWVLWLSAPFWFTLLSLPQTTHIAEWQKDIVLKLPFLVLPAAFLVLPRLSAKHYWILAALFIAIQTAIAVPTVVRYALHFTEMQDAIARNKSIEIVTKISHIYFGFILAFSGILAIELGRKRTAFFHAQERWLLLLLGGINLCCMHILTSRTGLVGLYAGLLTYVFILAMRRNALKKALPLMLVALVTLPLLAYAAVPSFRQRIDSTWFDVQSYRNDGAGVAQLSDLSVGARFVAWEAAWHTFVQNPVFGSGIGDMNTDLQAYYATQPRLKGDTLLPKTPHNQYLVYLCASGAVGFFIWLWAFAFPFWRMAGQRSALFWAFMALLGTAMLTESLLERQVGLSFFLLGAMLLLQSEKQVEM